MRTNRQMLALAALALITMIFSVGFFLGRRTVPFEIAAEAAEANAAPAAVAAESAQREEAQASVSDSSPDSAAQENQEAAPLRIDLNTATKEELMQLPRVGEVLAERILAYRAQYGRFSACEQLMDVEGIGEGTYEKLREYIYVEDGA